MDGERLQPENPRADRPPATEDPDAALLRALSGGDGAALAALYDRHGRIAFAVAYRVLGERGAAEDAVQDAFLSVWRNAGRYRPDRGSVRSWLLTIARNAAVDRRRGRHRRDAMTATLDDVAFGLEAATDDPFLTVAAGLEATAVRSAMASLPDEQRRAIELAYFGGLTHQEVADRTGEPLGTVKGRLRLGLQKLRAALTPPPTAAGAGARPGPAVGGGVSFKDVGR